MKVEIFDEGVAFRNDKKRLTVLLLVPYYSFYPKYETRRAGCPIGLELIASELITKGFNVVSIDACMARYDQYTPQMDGTIRYGLTDDQLERVLAQFNPAVVGVTSLFSNQATNVEQTAGIVRRVYPNAIIVEGGSHASGDGDEVLKSKNVDMIVNREGLVTFPELCLSVGQGQSKRNFTPCAGVSY